jgi:hypothetical protein
VKSSQAAAIKLLPERAQLEALAKQTGLSTLELLRVAPLPEASHLSSASEDNLLRNHRDKIVHVSPRRVGMRVCDALMVHPASGRD